MHDPISTSFNHHRAEIKWMYVLMYEFLPVNGLRLAKH